MRKVSIALALLCLVALSLVSAPARQGRPTVCFVTFSLAVAFFQSSVEGGRQEAEAQGADFIVQDPQSDTQRQVTQIEDCIARGVDAIVVDAIESSAVLGPIEEAGRRGIKVAAVDTFVDSPFVVSNIGVSNFDASREFGRFVAGWILGNLGGTADIGIMLASTEVQLARRDGFLEALKSIPNSRVVDEGDGRNILERAIAEAEDMILGNPSIKVIYATGDPQLQGALSAAASQGRNDIAMFGWDAVPAQFIQPLEEGRIVGFVTQQPEVQGQLGVRYALQAVRGEPVPANVDSPIAIVTQFNLDQFR